MEWQKKQNRKCFALYNSFLCVNFFSLAFKSIFSLHTLIVHVHHENAKRKTPQSIRWEEKNQHADEIEFSNEWEKQGMMSVVTVTAVKDKKIFWMISKKKWRKSCNNVQMVQIYVLYPKWYYYFCHLSEMCVVRSHSYVSISVWMCVMCTLSAQEKLEKALILVFLFTKTHPITFLFPCFLSPFGRFKYTHDLRLNHQCYEYGWC